MIKEKLNPSGLLVFAGDLTYLKAKREFHKALRAWKRDQNFSFYASLDLNHNSDKLFRLLRNKSGTQPNLTNRCTQVTGPLKAGPNILKTLVNHLIMTLMNPSSTKLTMTLRKWSSSLRTNLMPHSLKFLKRKCTSHSLPANGNSISSRSNPARTCSLWRVSLGLGLGVSIQSQPCGCIPPLECYVELKSGVLWTQSLKCSRGPIGKFLEQFKDSLSDVLRRALEHFLVVHLITYRKFSFLISIAALPSTALPR